jgi:transcription initiation factor IIE alpha subunit
MVAERVGCFCGWRSRRVRRSCEAEHIYPCRCHFGNCPKCGGAVSATDEVRQARALDRYYKALKAEGVI